ncbi:MAG: polymer-forming cytoskeletal protein [Lachnospiraceae bacterium]|nr:polymer-forming cytoskeletal protein [Lachnospiraceae bacterium]
MFGKKEEEIKLTTLIGEGAKLDGDFSALGSARIDGIIGGDVEVEGTLILGVSGKINGNVKADAAIIGGEVQGNIVAPKKAELTNTAKVMGDIQTAVIVIDEHAVFQGKCSMEQGEPDDKTQALAEKSANASKKSAQNALDEAMKEVLPLPSATPAANTEDNVAAGTAVPAETNTAT